MDAAKEKVGVFNYYDFIRNVFILLVVAAISALIGMGYGCYFVINKILNDGPMLGQEMMNVGIRLQAFNPGSDVFEWDIKGQGVFAGSWEELQQRLEASGVDG